MKQATRWDQKRYYNCWVVSSIGGGVLGFASYPNSDNNNDGSVVDIGTFGNTGNFFGGARRYGRTTTHEFGHGMNLAHPFQGGCGNSCTSSGDLVCDTPPTADQNFGKGFQRQNTCTNDRPDLPDNPRNYMDYLDDEGMTYFSLGQKTRMHNALRLSNNTQRFPLWQRRNLERTGTGPFKAPECDFVADNIQTCAGAAVTFFDFSIGSPHQFEWEFPGGVPATSTERNPEVVYPEAGFYSVTLTVTNRSGESSTKTKIGYITVSDQKVKIPYSFNFDDGSFEAEGFQVQNPDSTYINPNGNNPLSRTWGPSNFGAESSGGSARIEFFNYSEYGQKDGLVTPAIDLTGEDSVAVVFSHAYSPYVELDNNNDPQTPYYDSLAVWASGDCGQNWVRLYYKGGEELATRSIEEAAQFRAFVPNDDQWVTDTLNLARFAGSPNVRIRFEAINGFGNSLYIDEIKLERIGFTGRKPNSAAIVQKVTLAPNPSDNTTQVHLSLARTESVSLRVLDPLGRQVFSNGAQLLGAGEHSLPLQVPGLTAGIYMVQVQAGGHFQTKRWVVR
jgi:PKD repeat protein